MAEHQPDLKAEVEAATLAELERVGPEALNRAAVAARFEGRGASRATLYRYIARAFDSGKAGQHLARKVKEAAAERAKAPDPPAAVVKAAAAKLPQHVTMEEVAGAGPIPVIERLSECVRIADQLIAHARTEDGGVRSAKLLLAASEHMRRNLETAVRLQDSLRQTNDVQRFNKAVVDLIRGVAVENPEAAEAIVSRLGQLAAQWGG